eukprot:UN03540
MLIAAQKGHLETCKLLFHLNANINPKRKDGVTPFFVALWEKKFNVTKWLMKQDVSLDESLRLLETFPKLCDESKQWLIDTKGHER